MTPRKPTATEATVMEFVQAIWPDFTEAALSLFTEEKLMRDAIELIRKLRAVEVSAREVSKALHKADIHEVQAPLDIALAAVRG